MRTRKQHEEVLARRAVAAEWIETLKSAKPRDHVAFDEWLRESKLNVECYLEMEALDRQVQALDSLDRPDIEAIAAQGRPQILPLNRPAPARDAERRTNHRAWSMAAAAAGLIAVVGLAILGYRTLSSSDPRTAKTAIGEQRTLTLSDGSIVRMNAETALKIDYDARRRDIRMLSGEAIFKVAPDAVRPFVVRTPTAKVRALGTRFNVYQRKVTVVSVLEGRVQVTPQLPSGASDQAPAAQRLDAGEEVEIAQGRMAKRAHPDVAKSVAWREGQLYFDAMPLEDIVREFNRHGGPVRLTLEGVAPGTYRFGGTFNVDEPASLADILEEQDDLIVERRPGEIVIRPRKSPVAEPRSTP